MTKKKYEDSVAGDLQELHADAGKVAARVVKRKPKWSPAQLDLFEKMKVYLREEPRRFDMSNFGYHIGGKLRDIDPPCRTAFCLAGIAVICSEAAVFTWRTIEYISGKATEWGFFKGAGKQRTIIVPELTAIDAMGITLQQGRKLFYTDNWPAKFRKLHYAAQLPEEKLENGLARFDYFIETGR